MDKNKECGICHLFGTEKEVLKHMIKKHDIYEVYEHLSSNTEKFWKKVYLLYLVFGVVISIVISTLYVSGLPLMAMIVLLLIICGFLYFVTVLIIKLLGTLRGFRTLWLYKNG